MKKIIYIIIIFWLIAWWYIYLQDKSYYKIAKKYISNNIDYTVYQPPITQKSDYIWYKIINKTREQIWVVTSYDNSYYNGWYPPDDRWACSDVIIQTVKWLGYDIKVKLDQDMKKNLWEYPNKYDANINFRRVANLNIYMSKFAQKMDHNIWWSGFSDRLPGDIITYDRLPGKNGLRHIAIVSDKINDNWAPYIIHNYGNGTAENDYLLKRPAPITWRYRIVNWIK